MKKKLFIFGIAALLLFGGIMGGIAANDKSDVPPKVETTPNADEEQLPPKIPERYAPMRIDIAPNAQEQVPSKTSGQEASVVNNVANTPDRGLPIPVIREAVIVYFKEMPSLEAFASKYDEKLIFAKQDIKMAAFETIPVGEPGKTSQKTLDFIDEVSKDPGVERVFKDEFMFLKPDKAYSLEPKVVFPADMEDKYVANEVTAVFWRLPPSLEEFALKYGVKIKDVEDVLMFAVFETDDITVFLKKVSSDPYISSAHPRAIGQYDRYTPNDPMWDMFTDPEKVHTLEPDIKYPEYLDKMRVEYISNEVVVGFWRMPQSFEEFALKYGAKLKFADDVLLFAVFEKGNSTEFLKKISTDPYIRYAFPDTIGYIRHTPNDPKWDIQLEARKIYAPWDFQKGSTGINAAVLDTGIDYNHEDLSGHITPMHLIMPHGLISPV